MEINKETYNLLDYKDYLISYSLNKYNALQKYNLKSLKKSSYINKIINEKRIEKLLNKLTDELKPYKTMDFSSIIEEKSEEIQSILIPYLLEFDQNHYFFHKPFLSFFIDKGYINVAKDFINRGKKEDAQLLPQEVFQALRNVWIMNSLQIVWDIPLELTDSIYSYSMLYPYTDNYLDNKNISSNDKKSFNEKVTKTIIGENVISSNFNEERVFQLLGNIENQYNRTDFPNVFKSILFIQHGQIESLKQNEDITKENILPISFFKGGSSVLADGFLVKGDLNLSEMEFSFEYGAFLQLLDDFQDTVSDRLEGNRTIFSICDENTALDNEVLKLISYIFEVNKPNEKDSKNLTYMKDVICSCTLIMVMDAVGRNKSLVSNKLYRQLERISRVRLSFYNKLESKLMDLTKEFNYNLDK